MAETAALVVALSAQLTRFERDMKQAADVAEKRTREIETSFSRVNKAITTQLGLLVSTFTGRLGGVGTVLTSFGKAGLIAATGLGVAVAAMAAAAQIAAKFAEQADKLDQSAQNLGITATQMKALGEAGRAANQEFERTEQAFTKFIGGVEKLKDAQGDLYDSLRKTNPELLLQLTNAKDSAQAIEILVKHFGSLRTQTEKIALARAAGFTRGGVGTLQEVFDRGNLRGLTEGIANIDESTKKLADMKNELEKLSQKSFDILGNLVTEKSLDLLRNTHKEFHDIIKLYNFISSIDVAKIAKSVFRPPGPSNVQQVFEDSQRAAEAARLGRVTPAADLALRDVPAPVPPKLTPQQDLDQFKRAVAVLGEAVTLTEQYTLREKELAVAIENKDGTQAQANRNLEAFALAQKIAVASTLERLGVADKEIIAGGKLAEIEAARAKGLITETQAIQARTLAMREANEEAKKLEERRALLPGLKQLQNDAEDTKKQIDDLAVKSLKGLEDAFIDVASGTKKLSDAFKELVSSILKDLARLLIRQSVTGPLANLIQSGFASIPKAHEGGIVGKTSFPTTRVAAGAFLGAKHFQSGGFVGGEVPIVAHKGEIVGWPDQLRRAFGGGGAVSVVNQVVVQGDASEKTVALIRSELTQYARGEPDRVIRAVRQARERNVKL